jgi:hypothetical protein
LPWVCRPAMAIKPISCGTSNINLWTVGKTGQLQQGHLEEDQQPRQRGVCVHLAVRGRGGASLGLQ